MSGNGSAKSHPLTEAQHDAIERTDLSMAVTSGAGCGKTFVLARRYLKALLDDGQMDAPARVVAVTFTEKAAIEMHQRVAALLAERIAGETDLAARALLSEWLGRISDARIGTIHGFSAALLRRYAVEAGVDPSFAVLADEFQRGRMQREACHDALLAALEAGDEHLSELLTCLNFDRILEMLEQLLEERWRWKAADYADPSATLAQWKQRAAGALEELWASLNLAKMDERMRWLSQQPCSKADDKLALQVQETLALLAIILHQPESRTAQNFAALKLDLRGGSAAAWGGKEKLAEVKQCLRELVDPLLEMGQFFGPFNDLDERAARALSALTRITHDAVARYAAAKRAEGLLDFVDLQVLARDFLAANAEVRAQVAADIHHLLIDEFQDTDSLQQQLLWLAVDCTAETPPPGKVFFVGDAKQSIFRFRGAELDVFGRARKAMGSENTRTLDLNFRTHAAGLALVNHLFAPLMGPAYEPLSAHRNDCPPGPAAEILLASPEIGDAEGEEDGDEADSASPGGKKVSATQWQHLSARRMAERISEMIRKQERLVWDGGLGTQRAVRAGDIAILLPQLQNTAAYEEALQDAEIDYYVVAGAGLYRQQEVFDLLNALRTIDNPLDDVALMGFLRGGMVGLDDNALLHIARTICPPYRPHLRDGRLSQALSPAAHQRLAWAAGVLESLWADKDALGLDALLERLLEMTNFEAVLLGQFHGLRRCGNVHRVLEQARSARSAGASVREFIDFLSTLTLEEVRAEQAAVEAEGSNVVRIMTVHKAKGLEFPVVFLADLNRYSKGSPESMNLRGPLGLTLKLASPDAEDEGEVPQSYQIARGLDRLMDEAEEMRKFYVAVTRHQDYIAFVAGHEQAKDGRFGHSHSLLRRLDDVLDLKAALSGEKIILDGGVAVSVSSAQPQLERRGRKKSILDGLLQKCDSPVALANALAGPAKQGTPAELPFLAAAESAGMDRLAVTALGELEFCPACFHWHYELRVPSGMLSSGTSSRPAPAQPSEPPRPESALDPATLGTLFHRCMELLDFQNPQSAADLMHRALREQEIAIDEAPLAAELQEMLERFRRHPLWETLRSAKRRLNELEFVSLSPGLELVGKIDLLAQDAAGNWLIVDYKSDRVQAEELVPHAARYELQMLIYASAAGRHLGLPEAEGIPATLYFLRPGLELTFPAGQLTAQAAQSRLSELSARLKECRRSGVWPRRSDNSCRYCLYQDLCRRNHS